MNRAREEGGLGPLELGKELTEATVERLQEGGVNSPPRRENVLAPGLTDLGYGLAIGSGELYAVRTFAGPGVSQDQEVVPLTEVAVLVIGRRR